MDSKHLDFLKERIQFESRHSVADVRHTGGGVLQEWILVLYNVISVEG